MSIKLISSPRGKKLLAWQITTFVVLLLWSSFALSLAAGNALLASVRSSEFGTFARLTFGRVLAGIVVVVCIAALVSDSLWLQSFAFVAFAVFWIQGLAILHWLQQHRGLPRAVVIGTYVALPFLNLLLVMFLAVVGYFDAWFGFRQRLSTA